MSRNPETFRVRFRVRDKVRVRVRLFLPIDEMGLGEMGLGELGLGEMGQNRLRGPKYVRSGNGLPLIALCCLLLLLV